MVIAFATFARVVTRYEEARNVVTKCISTGVILRRLPEPASN